MSGHLSENEIERFLTSRLTSAERPEAVRHLLAGCGICSRKLVAQAPGRLLDEAGESHRRRASRDPLRDRAITAAQQQEARWRIDEKKLQQSLELLSAHPQGYDGLTFQQARSLQGKPLVEALLRRSWEVRFLDPKMMRWLAYNAVTAAQSLRTAEHAPPILLNLQARAWAGLANAYRVNNEYSEAEGALAQARALLRRSSGDLRLLAWTAGIEASLRAAQRRLSEAHELFDKVYRIYLKLGDRHFMGQVLLSKGVLGEYDDTYAKGVPLLKQGLALLDPDRDSQLVAAGQQSLITALVGSRAFQEAGQLLLKSDLRRQFDDNLRVRWVEGRLLAGLGQSAKAGRALTSVRERFLETEQLHSAALAGLDLIPVLLQQGKYSEVQETARESYNILRSLGIHHDAAKARRYLS